MCLMPYVNNKGADQPVHLRSLISTFVVCCLDSMIYGLKKKFLHSAWYKNALNTPGVIYYFGRIKSLKWLDLNVLKILCNE